ncbi:MAG: type II toxin-antitoxin system YafQ family toxin [Parcubacteria group bacterium]|nr:type II toxin-antitoxin system YafQ family toxin [Parcubacteria group bacterium]
MYEIIFSRRFKRSYKKLKWSGRFDSESLRSLLEFLREGTPPPFQYQDHLLVGEYHGCHECHLKGNILLIYAIVDSIHEVTLVNIGSHSELFG